MIEVVMKVEVKMVEVVVEIEVVVLVLVEMKLMRLWQSRNKIILIESSML